MRLKFEKMAQEFIPGSAKREEAVPAEDGSDVDLAAIVERLRNVPKTQTNLAFAEPVSAQLQPGDPGYRRPDPAPQRPALDPDALDIGYGLKPGRFGSRS